MGKAVVWSRVCCGGQQGGGFSRLSPSLGSKLDKVTLWAQRPGVGGRSVRLEVGATCLVQGLRRGLPGLRSSAWVNESFLWSCSLGMEWVSPALVPHPQPPAWRMVAPCPAVCFALFQRWGWFPPSWLRSAAPDPLLPQRAVFLMAISGLLGRIGWGRGIRGLEATPAPLSEAGAASWRRGLGSQCRPGGFPSGVARSSLCSAG